MKKILIILLTIVTFASVSVDTVYAKEGKRFEYSITTADEGWKEFQTKSEMVEALRIPEDVLKSLTTQELIELVYSYPLIVDLHLYNSVDDALNAFELNCDAYRELITRNDAYVTLQNNSERFDTASFESYTTEILLSSDVFESVEYELTILTVYPIYGTVYTPNGTSVSVFELEEYSQSYLDDIEEYVEDTYPNATYVSPATRKYNCHSYAWYSSSTSNTWWMNDPSAYMSDGSYTRVYSALSASRVYYPVGDHSMLIYDAYGRALSTATVISKWGAGPVMIHDPYYSPYSTTSYKLYV